MKKIPLTLILTFYCIITFSQVSQQYIGNSGFTGFVNKSAVLTDGKTVIAGAKSSVSGDNDAFVTCLDPSGNVLWSREVSTPKNDRFLAITATSDGGCVAAGYVASTLGTPFSNTQAAVYKFDNSGTVVWNKVIEITSYGEVFTSVIEIPGSNNIVCGGDVNFGTSAMSGLIINYTSAGTMNWAKRYNASGQAIHDMKYLSGNIICAGHFLGITNLDGRIFSIKETDGTVNWNRTYDYSSFYNSSIYINYFDRLNIVDDKIYVDAFISPPGTPSPSYSITPSILSVDTTGLNPFCLEYPVGFSSFSNVVHSKVVSKNEIYLFQHPSPAHWERMYSNAPLKSVTDVICTKIRDITDAAGSLVYVRKLGTTGAQGIATANVIDGKIIGWGGANNDPTRLSGPQDIFKLEADTALPVTPTNCVEDVTGQRFAYPSVTIYPGASFSSVATVTLLTPETPSVNSVSYLRSFPCKTIMTPDFSSARTGCYTIDFKDLSLKGSSGIKFWDWRFGDGGTSALPNPVHVYSSFGTYTVKLIVTDSTGDKDSIAKTITVAAYRFLTAGNDTSICASALPASVQLMTKGGKTFSWSPAAGLSNPAIANPVATVTGPIVYVVAATDSLGCTDKDSTIISIRTGTIMIIPDSAKTCAEEPVALNASGAVKYKWSPAAGLSTDTGSVTSARISATATYTVTGTDLYGCTAIDSVKITLLPPATVSLSQAVVSFCRGQSVQLEASGAKRYQWFSNDTDYEDSSSAITVIPGFSKYLMVKGWNAEGCFSIDSVYLSELPAPKVKIITKDPVVGCGKSTVLEATGAKTYTWWPSEYTNNSSGAVTTVFPPRTLYMQVQGTDSLGCKGTDSVLVNFDGKSLAMVPSGFTPNNDGINERIKPIIACNFSVSEFVIYNRWGEQVFSGDPNNSSWDGSYSGKPCSMGVYYYFLKGRDEHNNEIMLKGDITLIR